MVVACELVVWKKAPGVRERTIILFFGGFPFEWTMSGSAGQFCRSVWWFLGGPGHTRSRKLICETSDKSDSAHFPDEYGKSTITMHITITDLLLALAGTALTRGASALPPPPLVTLAYPDDTEASHLKFGVDIGTKFSVEMGRRVRESLAADKVDNYFKCDEAMANAILNELTDSHKRHFPKYFAEVQGFAEGSGVRQKDLLSSIFEQELTGIFLSNFQSHTTENEFCKELRRSNKAHCSDYGSCRKNADAKFLQHGRTPEEGGGKTLAHI